MLTQTAPFFLAFCVGFMMAQMELTLIISRFAQRLQVTPPADAPPPPTGMVVNRPEGGVQMAVRPARIDLAS